MYYRYEILRTDDTNEARIHNNKLLGPNTLGVEVTIPCLAARCGLGNIDPQHGEKRKRSSAIEESFIYEPLPLVNTTLVTIRIDKDSLGAMAVLTLRAQKEECHIEKNLVRCIGILDSMGINNARLENPALFENAFYRKAVDAIQQIVNEARQEPTALFQKVGAIMTIIDGSMPFEEIDSIIVRRPQLNGVSDIEMHGKVAFVLAPERYKEARDWANKRFAIAVICDPEFSAPDSGGLVYQRWSVIRKPGFLDRDSCEKAINKAEAEARLMDVEKLKRDGFAWGGPANIISSPHGKVTALTKKEILCAVSKYA